MRISKLNSPWNAMPDINGDLTGSLARTTDPTTGDAADISAEGQGKAEFSSPLWAPGDGASFTMSAYTSRGTSVTLEAHRQTFSMGKFARAESMFRGGDRHKSRLNLDITFTATDGKSQTFKVTDNMRFMEDKSGQVLVDDGRMAPRADARGEADNAIVVNLADGARLQGGDGDDVLFNLGQGAVLDGGAGSDTLLSMGDGSSLLGGDGNDTLKVVRDVIRKEDVGRGTAMQATEANLKKAALEGFEQGQSVFMDGGDGNDTLESDVKLHDSTILGGKGDDTLKFTTLVGSTLDAGTGDDVMGVDKLSASIVRGGDGEDTIQVGTAGNGSLVDGGKGDDTISADRVRGESWVRGGDGNDIIHVNALKGNSGVDGGDGDDTISVISADRSVVMGGGGNDTLFVAHGNSAVISGGKGDDVITVGAGTGNLISGDDGNDRISAGGVNSLVDGGAGTDIIKAPGASRVTDDGAVLKNGIADADLAVTVADLADTLDRIALDPGSQQRYQALLRYTMQQSPGNP